jgi:hypothetical protein
MSIEISLITALLASVFGSRTTAEALIAIYNKIFDIKTTDTSGAGEMAVADRKRLYLTAEKESEIATDAALEALDLTYDSTLAIRDERMRQARLAFNAALSLMIIGVVIIFIGVALLWIKPELNQGAITVAVGAITEVISVVVFAFNRDANNRLEEVRKELSAIETARVGLSMAKQISDLGKRDDAIADLTKRIQNNG